MKCIRDEAPTFAELGAKGRADEAILLENGQVKVKRTTGAGPEQNKSDETDVQWISLVAFAISTRDDVDRMHNDVKTKASAADQWRRRSIPLAR